MGVSIAFRFLAGRYHATPWDRHPNEGAVEWPPSPWRLLRAIIAAAHKVDGAPDPVLLRHVVCALQTPPEYHLPPSASAHTRSYQPLFGIGESSLVLDAFIAVRQGAGDPDARICVTWREAALGTDATSALTRWLDGIAYLGRAESWVEATLVRDPAEPANTSQLQPQASSSPVRLLAPADVAADELVGVLTVTTATLQKQRALEAPGTRWLTYHVPDRIATRFAGLRRSAPRAAPTLVRLALAGSVLPRFLDAVLIGDRVRSALMSRSRDTEGDVHPLFAGKTPDGVPLRNAGHLHVLPQDDDRDGRIDHVLLWASSGFDDRAMEAIMTLRRLYAMDGQELHLSMTGSGDVTSDAEELGVPSQFARHSPVRASSIWRSRTPFVPPRHMKQRGNQLIDTVAEQVLREISRLGLPTPAIEPLAATHAGRELPWRLFRAIRVSGGGSRSGMAASGHLLTFPEEVHGPMAIGYGARQGLGQFEPW